MCKTPRALNLAMENIENADILKAEIKSILAFKSKDGATFEDVRGKMKIEIKKK